MRCGVSFVAPAVLATLTLAGCAGGGSSAIRPASVLPAGVASKAPPAAPSAIRRTQSEPTCGGGGQDSFEGGGVSNAAGGDGSVVGGGITNFACDQNSSILGGSENGIGSAGHASYDETIGGGSGNWITYGVYSTIGGGVDNAIGSGAGMASFVGGGEFNAINADYGTIAGGYQNTVSSKYGAIVGGEYNAAFGEGSYVGGGGYNTASGEGAIVVGGFNSKANGTWATIPGGYVNSAAGTYSFAAGARASAAHEGAFVWSDGSDGDAILTSSRAYQFLARASGGVTFYTNAASTVGATLAPGSGTWASASDRNLKTDVARIDDAAVLDKVAQLPISRWSYKSERGVRHVGPMAQDFYAAFGVGEDDKHITSIDEDGVALAAIKALHAENARLLVRQEKMQRELERLVEVVSTLRAQRR
jgi:hypothetical protein